MGILLKLVAIGAATGVAAGVAAGIANAATTAVLTKHPSPTWDRVKGCAHGATYGWLSHWRKR